MSKAHRYRKFFNLNRMRIWRNGHKMNLVTAAAYAGHHKLVALLIEKYACTLQTPDHVLVGALQNGHIPLAEYLLSHTPVNWRTLSIDNMPLAQALLKAKNKEALSLLVGTRCPVCLRKLTKKKLRHIYITQCQHWFCTNHYSHLNACPLCRKKL